MASALSSCRATSVSAINKIEMTMVFVMGYLHSKTIPSRGLAADLVSAAVPGVAAVLTGPAGVATPPYVSPGVYVRMAGSRCHGAIVRVWQKRRRRGRG